MRLLMAARLTKFFLATAVAGLSLFKVSWPFSWSPYRRSARSSSGAKTSRVSYFTGISVIDPCSTSKRGYPCCGETSARMTRGKNEELGKEIEPCDPRYSSSGPIGCGDFVISRGGGPTENELSNENLLKILMIECSDLEANTLLWKCLGYRYDPRSESWRNDECFTKWREKYPEPPDLIGMQRIYTKEIDQPSLRANQALVRSVPVDNKQSLKTHLKPYGFKGYKYAELTPNKTRRAQCANWLLYYREELFGYSIDELKERRRKKHEGEDRDRLRKLHELTTNEDTKGNAMGKGDTEWKPPVREVF